MVAVVVAVRLVVDLEVAAVTSVNAASVEASIVVIAMAKLPTRRLNSTTMNSDATNC